MTFEKVYDILQQDVNYEKLIKPILKYLSKDKLTLDAGCGSGYILSLMAQQGYKLEGIDNNEEMLSLAKSRLDLLNLNVPLINHDLRKALPKKYDQIISLLDVSHYFMGVKKLFTNYYNALNFGGVLIIDLYKMPIYESEVGSYGDLKYTWDVHTSKTQIIHDVEVEVGNQLYDYKIRQYYKPLDEYISTLKSVGFKVKTINSFDDRKVFVICKKEK